MADSAQSKHRYLGQRLVVTGKLVLTSPAHFGNGDDDELTDLPLLLNEAGDERALITGASLAGALRNYLRERKRGYEFKMATRNPQQAHYQEWTETENELLASQLFGKHRGSDQGEQSPLIVNDALSLGEGLPRIEQRDGVALDPATRTTEDKKKYDYQLLAAGTEFELQFELLLENEDQARRFPDDERAEEKINEVRKANSKRLQALTLALQGLEDGEIRLGARKRRGFGCCTAKDWSVAHYQLHHRRDLLAWLAAGRVGWLSDDTLIPVTGEKIAPLLAPIAAKLKQSADAQLAKDEREWFELKAEFALDGSLMVRSGFEDLDEWAEQVIKSEDGTETKTEKLLKRRPDSVHLQTWNGEAHQPVLSGTSIAGALRQRALRIANTLKPSDAAKDFIDGLFGPRVIKGGEDLRASRLRVDEIFIENSRSLIQTRIKIDRFTGGTIESALLEEEPLFGGKVKICARLMLTGNERNEAEIGLLLLLLKDLWLGDLPLGGESAIGRGRLRGQTATLRWQCRSKPLRELTLPSQPDATFVSKEDAAELESYVAAFNQWKQEPAA